MDGFNWEAENKILKKLSEPFYRSSYRLGVDHAFEVMKEIFTGRKYDIRVDFNVRNPAAEEFIHTRPIQFSETWAPRVSDTTNHFIRGELQEGFANFERIPKLQNRVKQVYADAGEWRSLLIARTETIRSFSEATVNYYKETGVIKELEFHVAPDERLCEECGGMAGDRYPVDNAPGIIPVHPLCRCTWVPVVPENLFAAEETISPFGGEATPEQLRDMSPTDFFNYWKNDKQFAKFIKDTDVINAFGEKGDETLSVLWKKLGYDKKPKLVSAETFERMRIANNNKCFYRGIGGSGKQGRNYAIQFQKGDVYPGYGIHGNGTYCAWGENQALSTASQYAGIEKDARGLIPSLPSDIIEKHAYEKSILQIIPDEDIKFISSRQLAEDRTEMFSALKKELNNREFIAFNQNDNVAMIASRKEQDFFRTLEQVMFDDGRYATMRGFDGIACDDALMSEAYDGAYFVLLNRSKTTVSKELIDVKNYNEIIQKIAPDWEW